MEIFEKFLDWVIKLFRLISGMSLVGMMLITCLEVISRGFGHPLFGAVDIIGFLAVLCLAFSMPYTHATQGHVGVDLIVQKMKPRSQAIIDSINTLVGTILFGIVAWQMWLYAAELANKGEVSMTIMIPKSPFIYMVSVSFGCLALAMFADLIRFTGKAVKG